ncbi:MAG: hypothetical protein IKS33_09300, partial [Bacteroidales bacterium]|nr:hypothetical protein [Bacteroidales bacterium]
RLPIFAQITICYRVLIFNDMHTKKAANQPLPSGGVYRGRTDDLMAASATKSVCNLLFGMVL